MTPHIVVRDAPFYKGVTRDLKSPRQSTVLTYTEGAKLSADGIDLQPSNSCGRGINFCDSLAGALRWGPVVVEIFVPHNVKIVDAGNKLRAEKVTVGKIVDLTFANLSGANLTSADLRSADLTYADLRYANLTYANLTSADLRSADLRSADLRSADLTYADLRYAIGNANTTLPAGWKVTANGLIVKS